MLPAAAVLVAALQCPDGSPPPCGARPGRAAPTSVAVLAFENLSRDTADLYLADGITEELTNRLGGMERLRVSAKSVVRRAHQAAAGDVLAAGRALNVRYLVEGSLRRSGSRVRVSARLLRASDGTRVWGDDYDRTMDDLLAMQVDIAQEVARNVAGRLLPGEQRALARRPTASAAAYDHYLRGRYLLTRRTESSIRQAAAELDQALRLDPAFAAAEARRAQALVTAFGYGVELATPDSFAAWTQHSVNRALQLDSMSSDAWLSLALVRLWFPPLSLVEARAAADRAVALEPRNADAHHTLGLALMSVPDLPAASDAFQRALALEAGRAISALDIAQIEYAERRYDAARRWVDSAIALEPQQARNFMLRSLMRARSGDTAGARTDAELAVQRATGTVRTLSLAARVVAAAARGDSIAARRDAAGLETGSWQTFGRLLALVALGRHDEALALLERGPLVAIDRLWLLFPEVDPIRHSARFGAAIQRWAPPGARPL